MRNLELDCDINFRLSRLGWYYVNIYLLYCVGFFRQRTSDRCLWSRDLSIKFEFQGFKFQGVTQNLSWYLERIVFPRYWFLSHRYLMQLGACVLLLCDLLFGSLINYSRTFCSLLSFVILIVTNFTIIILPGKISQILQLTLCSLYN